MRRRGREIAEATARLRGQAGTASHPNPRLQRRCRSGTRSSAQDRSRRSTGSSLAGQSVAFSNDRSESLDVIESAPNLDDPDPFDLCLEGEMKAHLAEAISKLSEARATDPLSLLSRRTHDEGDCRGGGRRAFARSQIRQETMVKLRASLDHLERGPVPSLSSQGAYDEHP